MMLLLSRRKNQSIVINSDIKVTVVDIMADDCVRIGITAPKEVTIHRQEVFEAIYEKSAAAVPQAIEEEIPSLPICSEQLAQPDAATVNLTPRQASFVKRICTELTSKMILGQGPWRPVSRHEVVQAIIDSVEEMAIDLGKLNSLDDLKRSITKRP